MTQRVRLVKQKTGMEKEEGGNEWEGKVRSIEKENKMKDSKPTEECLPTHLYVKGVPCISIL